MKSKSKLTDEEKAVSLRRAKERLGLCEQVLDHMLIKRRDIIQATDKAEGEVMAARREIAIMEGKRRDY